MKPIDKEIVWCVYYKDMPGCGTCDGLGSDYHDPATGDKGCPECRVIKLSGAKCIWDDGTVVSHSIKHNSYRVVFDLEVRNQHRSLTEVSQWAGELEGEFVEPDNLKNSLVEKEFVKQHGFKFAMCSIGMCKAAIQEHQEKMRSRHVR